MLITLVPDVCMTHRPVILNRPVVPVGPVMLSMVSL